MENQEWPKRKRCGEKKETLIKKAKVRGDEHVNNAGKLVERRQTGPDCR